eukprot:TRINITY_DN314_c0_g1_i1.p1 TRINITY_DN314_c0_g1~~TRINITY_DN314_c0_g1_i1.p1  ORF type:complete len:177 (-),score=34.57 TRINITY_DN314_c0_g1_i1:66-596(-)
MLGFVKDGQMKIRLGYFSNYNTIQWFDNIKFMNPAPEEYAFVKVAVSSNLTFVAASYSPNGTLVTVGRVLKAKMNIEILSAPSEFPLNNPSVALHTSGYIAVIGEENFSDAVTVTRGTLDAGSNIHWDSPVSLIDGGAHPSVAFSELTTVIGVFEKNYKLFSAHGLLEHNEIKWFQ